jgi:transcriptional regulator with XRE-family HTH domain
MRQKRDERALKAFGSAVRARRTALKLSQEKLAELADLHRTYIADIERGTRNVSLINILRLAEAMETVPGDLVNEAAGG